MCVCVGAGGGGACVRSCVCVRVGGRRAGTQERMQSCMRVRLRDVCVVRGTLGL